MKLSSIENFIMILSDLYFKNKNSYKEMDNEVFEIVLKKTHNIIEVFYLTYTYLLNNIIEK